MDWKYDSRQKFWFSGPQNRIRIVLLENRQGHVYRLWDSKDWSGLVPGALPTWYLGQEWHQSLGEAQEAGESMLAGIEHAETSLYEFEQLLRGEANEINESKT